MDGPAEGTQARAPKRPYPKDDVDEEEEERHNVCYWAPPIQTCSGI